MMYSHLSLTSVIQQCIPIICKPRHRQLTPVIYYRVIEAYGKEMALICLPLSLRFFFFFFVRASIRARNVMRGDESPERLRLLPTKKTEYKCIECLLFLLVAFWCRCGAGRKFRIVECSLCQCWLHVGEHSTCWNMLVTFIVIHAHHTFIWRRKKKSQNMVGKKYYGV